MTEQTAAARHAGYVAIVGRPNVGKSTLLNRLIGQKLAITSHKAQTTRHTILGIRTRPAGQIVYIDTPGIHRRGESALNRYLNRAARALLADADLALFVVRANAWNAEDQAALEALQLAGLPVVAVVNKVDRVDDKALLLPFLDELSRRHDFVAVVPVSAKTGDNLAGLDHCVIACIHTRRVRLEMHVPVGNTGQPGISSVRHIFIRSAVTLEILIQGRQLCRKTLMQNP